MPFWTLLRAASAFLKQQPWGGSRGGHTQSPCQKRFMIRVSSSCCLAECQWFLPAQPWACLGLYLHFSSTQPTTAGTVQTQLTLGRWESPTPNSWGGQHQPNQSQTLVPQLPGHHRPSASDDKIMCMQIPLCLSATTQSWWYLTSAWALLSHTHALSHFILLLQLMRASHTMLCLSLLLPVSVLHFNGSWRLQRSNPQNLTLEQNGCLLQTKYNWTIRHRSPQAKKKPKTNHTTKHRERLG